MRTLLLIACLLLTGCGKTEPIIFLKDGGQFANYCTISTNVDYDRAINKNNITVMRKIEQRRLEVDGRLVILFNTEQEREEFINGVTKIH